jgi:hypothetical protein
MIVGLAMVNGCAVDPAPLTQPVIVIVLAVPAVAGFWAGGGPGEAVCADADAA